MKRKLVCHLFFVLFLGLGLHLNGQNATSEAITFFKNNLDQFNASSEAEWIVTDSYADQSTGLHHVYLQQSSKDILLRDRVVNIHLNSRNEVIHYGGSFIPNFDELLDNREQLNPQEAVRKAFEDLALPYEPSDLEEFVGGAAKKWLMHYDAICLQPIEVKLMYVKTRTALKLVWAVDVYLKDGNHWWHFSIDASSGTILEKRDQVIHCHFEPNHFEAGCSAEITASHIKYNAPRFFSPANAGTSMSATYNVYPLTVESPNHGNRTLEVDPADPIASPFGWHDTDGISGAEFTITRGNNVLAQEDENGNNGNGFSPDGGSNLNFDFPIDFSQAPTNSRSAALTNLFYWNNIIHDIAYHYGFDEESGNFQENNYDRGGVGSDYVLADGLDGSGLNNANFSTPPDGSNPRMQMFLWSAPSSLEVTAPIDIAGTYNIAPGNFGASNYTVLDTVVLADDGSSMPTEVCNPPIVNTADISGNIALIDRGNCEFGSKSLAAQNAGAIAVLICNNVPGAGTLTMGGGVDGGSVTIPAAMLSYEDCQTIKMALPDVVVSFSDETGIEIDGDFDNGIIAHEYAHGISIRLTGGPSNTFCLNGNEQMGEGWSDYWGLVTTVLLGDDRTRSRGIGTYPNSEPITGVGIRNFPYSPDMNINPFTYNDISGVSIPHGVGSVWCTMLWDLYWDLVDVYGYDPNLYSGTGGNNIAINLVMNGMKMQSCNPGFVDGRDAILAADNEIYSGAHQCIIWRAFARRGLGFSATQGSSNSVTDGSEAFDLPAGCDCVVGSSCDDGDDCTSDDVFDANCECNGTFQDDDNDGVCDVQDQCPGFDDTIDDNNNGLPDACENCVTNIAFENETISTGDYFAQFTITTTGTVTLATEAAVNMNAGTSIVWSNGFHAPNGTTLTAQIAGCTPTPALEPLESRTDEALTTPLAISLLPNPARELVQVELSSVPKTQMELSIFDINGKHLENLSLNSFIQSEQQLSFSVAHLASGIYLLRLKTAKQLQTIRFVVEQ